jgi:outer membrane receptor protein involved in Fe transport
MIERAVNRSTQQLSSVLRRAHRFKENIMNTKKLLVAAAIGAASVTAQLYDLTRVEAQNATTGAVRGIVKDSNTGEALVGVTVVATSPSLQGTQSAITDENGLYLITTLPPGVYQISFFYADATVNSTGVAVSANGTTTNNQKINPDAGTKTVINVKARASLVDVTSNNQGIKITSEILQKLPVRGRSFEAAALQAAGTRGDGTAGGVSVSGSSSLENHYVVDGVPTGSLALGTQGSPVVNDFLEEIEIVTGGYNAEYGRSTGGVISAVTKSGTNELKGTVFAYLQPGALVGTRDRNPSQVSPIDVVNNTGFNYDVGFEVGGPIIKDKLWYFAGFAPRFVRRDITRNINRRTDCRITLPDGKLSGCVTNDPSYRDTKEDKDPLTGLLLTDRVFSETRYQTAQSYGFVGKLNYAYSANQQGQVSVNGSPARGSDVNAFGASSVQQDRSSLQTDVSAKWTSKFNNNKTEVEALFGWHREDGESHAQDPAFADTPLERLSDGSLAKWADLGAENPAVKSACADNVPGDPYPTITNCRVTSQSAYFIGGPGSFGRDLAERKTGKLSLVQRVKALGSHEFKAGLDAELNNLTSSRLTSGGVFFRNTVGRGQVRVSRFVQLADDSTTDPRFDTTCSVDNPDFTGAATESPTIAKKCDILGGTPGSPGTEVNSETVNWAAYLRDSWQVRPNFTLNLGLRYEEQRLRHAQNLQFTKDPITGQQLGKNAMTLTGMLAPRIGFTYDWTKEGKSKIFANWGRYYESIPLQINKRSFGGEVSFDQTYLYSQCRGQPDPQTDIKYGINCVTNNPTKPQVEQYIGAAGVLVAPNIKAQYLDETLIGAEYELIENLKLGIAYSYRTLGRVIEDVSTDNANTYIIANPGDIADSDLANLEKKIAATDDALEKKRLQKQYNLFKGIKVFDTPRREYHSIVLTAVRRFSKELYMQASYTYSQNRGNYPGLGSANNGQLDPNISSQYDLVELLANRNGVLEQDTPHNGKVNGFYTFDMNKAGELTLGLTAQFASGTPYNALGAHYLYGEFESFLLPRGSIGRSAMDYRVDAQLSYTKALPRGMKFQIFVQAFNLFDNQNEAGIDDAYANNPGDNAANPIVGGQYTDLIWAKTVGNAGNELSAPLQRNTNFGKPAARYAPISGLFGAKLFF